MVDIEYLGFTGDRAQRLTELPIAERRRLLDAPYFPFDGMNEHGLTVGMAAVPASSVPVDPSKQTIGSLQIIREMLDHAKNVDEAVSIFESYNVDMSGGPAIHYLVADATGQAALLEFYHGETFRIPNAAQWHQATNFLLSARGESVQGECKRYDSISAYLSKARGDISDKEAMTLLSRVAQEHTQWSVVYKMSTGDVNVVMGRNWDEAHVFHLDRAAP
jgi:predicted choloylglycine hydrolase